MTILVDISAAMIKAFAYLWISTGDYTKYATFDLIIISSYCQQ